MTARAPRRIASESRAWVACVVAAVALHCGGVMYFARSHAHAAAPPKLRELEVTMLDPEPLPPPAPAPVAPEPTPEPDKPMPVRERAKAAAPPSPARAGALLTQPETPSQAPADAPVRFVTDPKGRGYGSGMVARGGTAEHAEQAVRGPDRPAPVVAAPKPGLVFAERLSRQPSLGASDPCRGYFPQAARSLRGEVSVISTVRLDGSVARTDIESESPVGQGFGAAARACLARQRFSPALDDAGKPTAARTRVRITFSR